jgi:hypothetical protein
MNIFGNTNLDWLDFYQILIGSITFIYFEYDKIKKDGWEKVYIFFNSNIFNFIRWGREQSVLLLLEKIRVSIIYIFIVSFILIVIIAKFPILNFLSDIILYTLMFSMFSIMSFSSILNFKKESIKLLKGIFIVALIFIAMFSIVILFNTPNVIEYIRVISDNRVNLSVNELYLAYFMALLFATVTVSFMTYIMYWCFMGFIPTVLLLFVFLVVKSAYLLDSVTKVKGVGSILIFLNIIGLILNGMYN